MSVITIVDRLNSCRLTSTSAAETAHAGVGGGPGGITRLLARRHCQAARATKPEIRSQRFEIESPQRASAASSLTRASTQRAPSGVTSFFQKGAWVLR